MKFAEYPGGRRSNLYGGITKKKFKAEF